ncbi:hypothetical protein ACJROX_12505 [Pseudalkalibacillus sp. A8]
MRMVVFGVASRILKLTLLENGMIASFADVKQLMQSDTTMVAR